PTQQALGELGRELGCDGVDEARRTLTGVESALKDRDTLKLLLAESVLTKQAAQRRDGIGSVGERKGKLGDFDAHGGLPKTEGRRPKTDYRLPTTDYRLPITDYRTPIAEHRLPTLLAAFGNRLRRRSALELLQRKQAIIAVFPQVEHERDVLQRQNVRQVRE